MTTTTIPQLIDRIKTQSEDCQRFLVALAGPPGSGKSTLAEVLAEQLGPTASVLPMDGFHLSNDVLVERGRLHRKGAPDTFDVDGFRDLLSRVRAETEVLFPTFDRAADATCPDTGRITRETRVVLVEGNYLLLNTPPWSDLAQLFDMTVQLRVDRDVLEARLIERWVAHGLPMDQARARAADNDMRNVDFLADNSQSADFELVSG